MLLGDKVCTIAPTNTGADVNAALRAFQVAPWALAVEMDGWQESLCGFELPSTVQERLRPTTGTLIGVGADWLEHVSPGDAVIVDRAVGYWFTGFDFGGYEAHGQVRVYGTGTGASLVPRHYPALDAVMGVMEDTGIRAVGRWVLIRRDKPHQSEFGLELPDSQKYRSGKAVVVSGTGRVKGLDIEPGSKVLYNVEAVATTLEGLAHRYPQYEGDAEDYCFIDAREILMVTE